MKTREVKVEMVVVKRDSMSLEVVQVCGGRWHNRKRLMVRCEWLGVEAWPQPESSHR